MNALQLVSIPIEIVTRGAYQRGLGSNTNFMGDLRISSYGDLDGLLLG